jgi:hypothetical protein
MKPADLSGRLRRIAARRGWEIVISQGGNHTKVTLNGLAPEDLEN